MRGRSWLWVLLGAAVVLVVVGGGLLMTSPAPNGWFDCVGGLGGVRCMTPVQPGRVAGAVCSVAGLVLVAGILGWVLGRRSGHGEQRRTVDE